MGWETKIERCSRDVRFHSLKCGPRASRDNAEGTGSGKFSIILPSDDTFAAYLGRYGGRAIHMMYSASATYSTLTA
jgi:hypothetical protein